MLIRTGRDGFDHPHASEITPRQAHARRRALLRAVAGAAALAAMPRPRAASGKAAPLASVRPTVAGATTMEKPTSLADATGYNNFYEFGTGKQDPARLAKGLQLDPWSVQIEGLVARPGRIALEDLLKLSPLQERTYRLRCVEGWSMVIPWIGYSLSALLERVQPLGSARYVEFATLADPGQMPGIRMGILDWPYTEGLRLDEAMHPLTLLCFGMYGQALAPQNGAPVRVVVPWKYGFKSAKSLVRIRLLESQPRTAWNKAAPDEYGFFANVNPKVDHPRWSQASERRIGEDGLLARKRPTLMFNGYEAQVGQLYAGMDLRKSY